MTISPESDGFVEGHVILPNEGMEPTLIPPNRLDEVKSLIKSCGLGVTPPPELKDRIMDAAKDTPQLSEEESSL